MISAESLREWGYRLLIEMLAARGEVAAALQTYEQVRVTLRDELGITPSAAIRVVHDGLLAGGDPSEMHAHKRSARRPAGLAREASSRHAAERRRIAQALHAAASVRLADDRVARLVERTEGWSAAMYRPRCRSATASVAEARAR